MKLTIDCQDCGATLRKLAPEDAQKVSMNPQNFIFFCRTCRSHQEQS